MKTFSIAGATKAGLFLILLSLVGTELPAQKLKDKLIYGGKESSLKDKGVKELTMMAEPNPTLAPGASFKVGMTAVLDDGKEMKTQGLADGKVKWANYSVTVTGGTFSDGNVSITDDPRRIPGYKVTVKIALVFDTTKFKTMDFTLNFIAKYYASFNGRDGENGKYGDKGATGSTGKNEPKGTGGDGGKGGSGRDGGQGGNGEAGQAVDVYVTAFKDVNGATLLKVYCKSRSTSHEEFFIVNPNGGSVQINARGGSGGGGGHGGDGGGGGSGGNGHERGGNTADTFYGGGGKGGEGGDGGNGGDGGDGGNGGNVTIYLDPSAAAYANIFTTDTQGGREGSLGLPGTGQGPGSGGTGDNHGGQGGNGKSGKNGSQGRPGQNGPKPTVMTQAVTIDWEKVATGN